MTCREFRHLWITRRSDELPDAARTHLALCPTCATVAQADLRMDAVLRRLAATQPAPDVDAARAAIRRAIAERAPAPKAGKASGSPFLPLRWLTSEPGTLGGWRRPGLPLRGITSMAAAGLAAAAVVAALVLR